MKKNYPIRLGDAQIRALELEAERQAKAVEQTTGTRPSRFGPRTIAGQIIEVWARNPMPLTVWIEFIEAWARKGKPEGESPPQAPSGSPAAPRP